MAYFRIGVVGTGEQVVFSESPANAVWSDRRKPLHVVYETFDKKRLGSVKALLGPGFEAKELDSYTIVFLTEVEAQALIQHKLATEGLGR